MKLLALDIDGTLITREHKLTDRVRTALLDAQRAGKVRVILASGRPTAALRELSEALQLAQYGGYLMPFNGGLIIEAATGKVLQAKLLDADLIPQLHDLTQAHGVNIITYTDDYIISKIDGDPYAEEEVTLTGMPLRVEEQFVEAVKELVPKCLGVGPTERLIPLEAAVKEQLGDRVAAFRSSVIFLELVPKGVNKGSSLERLLPLLGKTPEDLIAMGDNYNDVEMLRLAGTGVAMGNAPEDIRQLADFVTLTNEEDGVAYALEQLLP